MGLVKQHRGSTPVPTVHPQSLSTLDVIVGILFFQDDSSARLCKVMRCGDSPGGGVASKQIGREEGEPGRP